ncbi:MAG: serine hydrolase [Bryobacterales bacterium]|nr:beta-lactamase family protein [Bryobacteraceae bacterium]MDW8130426.1 serine hydrolase [Bryobacterales bacterium]
MRAGGRLRRAAFAAFLAFATACAAQTGSAVYPGKDWERVSEPESAGFSRARLDALRSYLRTLDTTAMMVVAGGRVVFEYGDVTRLSYLASVRKSVLAMLYGNYVASGKIRLQTTLRELGFTDIQGLLPIEQEATIEHLLTARSGIYHPASNPGDSTAMAPPRGSQKPGTYFLYNNWDFNAAGAIFERLTGRDIYDALETDLARPVEMQDFDRSKQKKAGDAKRSMYPAYHMWLSTRDMARLGYLMLREGAWAGRQVIPRDWARKIVSLVTPLSELNPLPQRENAYGTGQLWGYGYMWWVWDAPGRAGPMAGAYTGMGAYGQYLTVLPALDVVVAHKTDPQEPRTTASNERRPRSVSAAEYFTALQMVIAARCGERCR